jgi:hypothetical protein
VQVSHPTVTYRLTVARLQSWAESTAVTPQEQLKKTKPWRRSVDRWPPGASSALRSCILDGADPATEKHDECATTTQQKFHATLNGTFTPDGWPQS